jgi:hypothetical protein
MRPLKGQRVVVPDDHDDDHLATASALLVEPEDHELVVIGHALIAVAEELRRVRAELKATRLSQP